MAKSKANPNKNIRPLTADQVTELTNKLDDPRSLNEQDCESLKMALATLTALQSAYLASKAKLKSLLAAIFGPKTEKSPANTPGGEKPPKTKPGGRGRNRGPKDFPGATVVECNHPDLKEGDICPNCQVGVLKESDRRQTEFFDGSQAVGLTIYLLQTFVCTVCRKVFTAPLPTTLPTAARDLSQQKSAKTATSRAEDRVGDEVSTERPIRIYSVSMVLSLITERFFKAVPHYRLAQVMQMAGIPLSTSTQYTVLKKYFGPLAQAIFKAMKKKAAAQTLFVNDDTPFRILEYERSKGSESGEPDKKSKKTRSQTSAIWTKGENGVYCLFDTSRGAAGKFLDEIIKERDPALGKPLQMSDGLKLNDIKNCEVLRGRCLDHARRKFHAVKESFPAEWKKAKVLFGAIYKADADAKELGLNSFERMLFHQYYSRQRFEELLAWCKSSLADHQVEPNSGLGKAMKYFNNQAHELRAFLEVPGMPLSSIEVERLIKRFVLLRKNCLQFNSKNGAELGDAIMSIIATCVANQLNPQDYIRTLLENPAEVLEEPGNWLPSVVGKPITYPKARAKA
jgi:transposase